MKPLPTAIALTLASTLIATTPTTNAATPLPSSSTEKLLPTPHFYQEDPAAHFAADGSNYCCPTAISDSLLYLANHGFPKLFPPSTSNSANSTDPQITLIKTLASPTFMNTDPTIGTDAGQACAGLQHYIQSSGYRVKSLQYRGWRPLPKSLAAYTTTTLPTPDWLKQAAADPRAAVWLNIGWYVKTETPGELKRVGGHWVALVGFGIDANQKSDANALLIDNPAVPAPTKPLTLPDAIAASVLTTAPAEPGRLIGNYAGLPRDTTEMYRLAGPGLHLSKKFDAALLDGAITLTLADPNT